MAEVTAARKTREENKPWLLTGHKLFNFNSFSFQSLPKEHSIVVPEMKKNHHVTSGAMTLALSVTSCMPVPPFTTPVSPEVTGRVLDAKNKKPIKGALIQTERAGYTRQAYTLDDGRFTVPSASQWHYLVYLGSPGFYPTPWMFNGSNKDLIMTVEASGYKSRSEVFHMKDQGWDVNLPESLETTLDPQ